MKYGCHAVKESDGTYSAVVLLDDEAVYADSETYLTPFPAELVAKALMRLFITQRDNREEDYAERSYRAGYDYACGQVD